jgi:hypothetical protein
MSDEMRIRITNEIRD